MNVYVFKTSIEHKNVETVNSILHSTIPESKWNFDLGDCDNILRVESRKEVINEVCSCLNANGFACEELK